MDKIDELAQILENAWYKGDYPQVWIEMAREIIKSGYYQLPPELVEKLRDDCPQCHGKGNVVYLGSIDILPCPKCKGKKKVGEPHLERLVVQK